MRVKLYFHGYNYFPYEERLARREVQTLLGEPIVLDDGTLQVDIPNERLQLVRRLTYFAKAVTEGSETILPDQAKWEASANGWDSATGTIDLSRQSTRYSLHGLHEYKGRFNPQIVRAIGNLMQVDTGSCILDPFCGCGTALLEAAHIGWDAVGLDLNPLAVLIANAKIQLLKTGFGDFKDSIASTLDNVGDLADLVGNCESPFDGDLRSHLSTIGGDYALPARAYLERWFPGDVLLQLQALLALIEQIAEPTARSALRICLSNILRQVSWQDPSDLRIRRRKEPSDNYPAVPLFRKELDFLLEKTRNVENLRHLLPSGTHQLALHCDTRREQAILQIKDHVHSESKRFDAAFTSPPYANALPYIDTQRLSLVMLDLADASDIRAMERALIGNREITNGTRQSLEADLETNVAALPLPVHSFLTDLLDRVRTADVGFRRKNRPALLYQYFADMKQTFVAVKPVLLPQAPFALVVGTNRTRIDGEEIVIPTPEFLHQIALSVGYASECQEELDTYQRYDLHQANSINSEMLIIVRAPD